MGVGQGEVKGWDKMGEGKGRGRAGKEGLGE